MSLFREELDRSWEKASRLQSIIDFHRKFRAAEAEEISVEAIVRHVSTADPSTILVTLRHFCSGQCTDFRSADLWQLLVRMVMACAERYAEKNRGIFTISGPCDLVPVEDELAAVVVAAATFSYGLHFSPQKERPDNVAFVTAPLPELGVPDEQPVRMCQREMFLLMNRLDQHPEQHELPSPSLLGEIVGDFCTRRGFSLILSVRTDGLDIWTEPSRHSLSDEMKELSVEVFFYGSNRSLEESQRAKISQFEIDFKTLVKTVFSVVVAKNEERTMQDSGNTYNGPIGTLVVQNGDKPMATVHQTVCSEDGPFKSLKSLLEAHPELVEELDKLRSLKPADVEKARTSLEKLKQGVDAASKAVDAGDKAVKLVTKLKAVVEEVIRRFPDLASMVSTWF